MAEERAADAPAKPAPKRKPRVRTPPKPIDVNYRMAYVGTTSIVGRPVATQSRRATTAPRSSLE
jgi:hypothetical protein